VTFYWPSRYRVESCCFPIPSGGRPAIGQPFRFETIHLVSLREKQTPCMKNQVAFVTGAAGGIGREIAARLMARSVSVLALDASPAIGELVSLSTTDAQVFPLVADVMDAAQCEAAVAIAERELGPISFLVNAAGVMHKKSLTEHTLDDWDSEMGVNVRAAFVFCRAVVPGMAERGDGAVVNIASIWAHRGGPDRVAYVAAKHAVIGLTRALAAEYGPTLRINSVSPGPTRTPMTAGLGGDQTAWMDPGEVADVVDFLCGPASRGITGTDVEVFGRGRPVGL
jgi:NAD(P)-dependent dehydrogenase (short-subunit alcohol dehydrogenase family)